MSKHILFGGASKKFYGIMKIAEENATGKYEHFF
jgi:hypothetical protein